MTPTLEPCAVCRHPAAWSCPTCGPGCADHVKRLAGPRLRFRCDSCGADAELRRVPRSSLVDLRELVKQSLEAPVRGRLALAWVAAALGLWLTVFSTAAGLLVGGALTLGLSLHLLRTRAEEAEFDWPAVAESRELLGIPLARALLANLAVLVLAFVLVERGVLTPFRTETVHAHSLAVTLFLSPRFWLTLGLVAAVVPFATLQSVVAETTAGIVNPVELVRLARRWPRAWGWAAALAGGGALVTTLLNALTPRGPLSGVVVALAASYVFFATAGFLGALLQLHASELGWGRADESWVDLGDPNAPELWEPPAPSDAGPVAASQSSLEARLTAALEARDAKLALEVYDAGAEADETLPPALLLRLGQAAASLSLYRQALQALTAAGRHGTPDASKALVIAARIFDERMRDTEAARRLFQQVVERFPGTQAADYSGRQLADPRFVVRRPA